MKAMECKCLLFEIAIEEKVVQLYVIVSKDFGFFQTSIWLQGAWSGDPNNPDFMLNMNGDH